MAINRAYLANALYKYNYFPMVKDEKEELPPCFTSEGFSTDIAAKLVDFRSTRKALGFDGISLTTTRFQNLTRLMNIPHPLAYSKLAQCIIDNWPSLEHICHSKTSLIKPSSHNDGRAIIMTSYNGVRTAGDPEGRLIIMRHDKFPDDLNTHLELSFAARYCVDADIAACFPSLYSHAIPWAAVGHEVAKSNRDESTWYNALDKHSRYASRNETHGVPIGPATSNILCELILAKVDERLKERGYKYFRIIDDYKCYCESVVDAEQFIADLEHELSLFSFRLNAGKVTISETPKAFKNHWLNELDSRMRGLDKIDSKDVLSLFDYALSVQGVSPADNISKYCAKLVRGKMKESAKDTYLNYALYLSFHNPTLLPVIGQGVSLSPGTIDKDRMCKIIYRFIELRRTDAVSWGLYILFKAGHTISDTLAKRVVEMGDCMSSLMLLVAKRSYAELCEIANYKCSSDLDYDRDKYWLLIYELALVDPVFRKQASKYLDETGLSILADAKLSFINPSIEDEREIGDDSARDRVALLIGEDENANDDDGLIPF